jgi:hypothetical protein
MSSAQVIESCTNLLVLVLVLKTYTKTEPLQESTCGFSGMGGQYFDAKVADLRPIGQGSLEEKSTSQAQFRTMAAAAHDPKFARKVGIKQSVAREFNKADKGQSYKSLPKRAD